MGHSRVSLPAPYSVDRAVWTGNTNVHKAPWACWPPTGVSPAIVTPTRLHGGYNWAARVTPALHRRVSRPRLSWHTGTAPTGLARSVDYNRASRHDGTGSRLHRDPGIMTRVDPDISVVQMTDLPITGKRLGRDTPGLTGRHLGICRNGDGHQDHQDKNGQELLHVTLLLQICTGTSGHSPLNR
jgi:hypothetical protein